MKHANRKPTIKVVSYFDDIPDDDADGTTALPTQSDKNKVVLIKNFDFETGEVEYEEYDSVSELKKRHNEPSANSHRCYIWEITVSVASSE